MFVDIFSVGECLMRFTDIYMIYILLLLSFSSFYNPHFLIIEVMVLVKVKALGLPHIL